MPLQLLDNRYRDYVGFPPLLRSGENDGKSFSDFYRASQIELFSALDNVLSQKAEDTLNQFAAVKKAEVNFQTSLGNRKGQLGINLIGAFAERQNNAFGWQVRVYGAQQDGKGFNAGVFYRHITDIALFGANAFVDYENHKLGNFYRYSIGGEAQNQYGSFAVNYYVPITDEKRKDGGGVIFSRKGYDAKLRLNIPNAKFLKAAVDYYNFGDEHGAEMMPSSVCYGAYWFWRMEYGIIAGHLRQRRVCGQVMTVGCEVSCLFRFVLCHCRWRVADCRLPIAGGRFAGMLGRRKKSGTGLGYCRLPIADCRLPIADCRLPILRQRRLRSSYSGWFVSCLFLCVMPMASATDKSHYT